MGNEQSNTYTGNYKVFRIIRKSEHSGWFRCFLDDYVNYSNGNYMHIDFKNESGIHGLEFTMDILGMPLGHTPYLDKGDYIRIDMNYSRKNDSSNNFSASFIEKVGYESVDSEGNISIFGLVGGVTQEILDSRRRYAEMARERQYQNQIVLRQTSWNMPPR